EEPSHLRRILDLLHDARREERRQVGLAKAIGDRRHGLTRERVESRRMSCFEQIRFGRPAHERVPPIEQDSRKHGRYATRALTRRILWALLALAPVTILVNYVTHADKVLLFVLSCAALIPLAWLIGEATEH